MKNLYEFEVRAQCPVNPTDVDLYSFTVESQEIIEVERIDAFMREHAGEVNVFQEDLTRKAAVTLGAKVTSVGYHGRFKVTCVAP